MLAFDLPDYSKSSSAQNEKLVSERERKRQRHEEGILQGPDIHVGLQLSQILSPSSRASRRFGITMTFANMAADKIKKEGIDGSQIKTLH